ncbi:MAG: transcription antitermination factor NusB [Bdellovibrionales bacterium GWB1_55_8]|nr:MAG: transcription antitermination factor NusB [Bdellovibrionales bacterium GWB1_55_8]
MKRHLAREIALQFLYRHDMEKQSDGVLSSSATAGFDSVLARALQDHFEHFQVPADVREFSAQLVAGTLKELAELDVLIEKHASNWKMARMALVDRNLLRLSAYELLRFPETAASIVIDEAIELAKEFGTSDSPAFINGILDALQRQIRSS